MTEFQKIYAPRPVKAHSNIKCSRHKNTNENFSDQDLYENSFRLTDNNLIITESRINKYLQSERKIICPTLNKEFLFNNESFEIFCKQLEKDLKITKLEEDETKIKDEIFSILKLKKSTLGCCYRNYALDYLPDEASSNSSKIPARSKNPFYKNLELNRVIQARKYFSGMNNNKFPFDNYFLEDVDGSFNINNSKENCLMAIVIVIVRICNAAISHPREHAIAQRCSLILVLFQTPGYLWRGKHLGIGCNNFDPRQQPKVTCVTRYQR